MLYSFSHTKRQKSKLPLTINLAGYNHLQEPVSRDKIFPLYQWIYCVDGEGELILRGQKYILYPGQLALIYAYEPHSYHAITKEWHVHIVGFSGNCCGELLRTFRLHESGIYHLENSEIFHIYFKKIMEIRNRRKEKELPYKKKKKSASSSMDLIELSKICYDFLLDLSLSIGLIRSSLKATNNESVKMMISYIEEHYQETIALDDLAAYVNLSKSYVSEVFKKEMQQTVVQYINKFRISQARIMLEENPEKKAGEIGKKCGFENPSYFSETFKKEVGMTPVEYRQRR